MNTLALRAGTLIRKLAWEGERLRWRLFHPVTLGARVVLLREGEVLFIRHTYRDGWYLPGGGVDKDESLEDAARREAEEEVNATVADVHLLGIFSHFSEGKSDHVAVFYSKNFELRDFEPNNEIAERAWFAVEDLPADVSPGTRRRINDLVAGNLPETGPW